MTKRLSYYNNEEDTVKKVEVRKRKQQKPAYIYPFIGLVLSVTMVLAVNKTNNKLPAQAYMYEEPEMTVEERIETERKLYEYENDSMFPPLFMNISEANDLGNGEGGIIELDGVRYIIRSSSHLVDTSEFILETFENGVKFYRYRSSN